MYYELRSYDIDPAGLEAYLQWANEKAIPLLRGAFGFRVIGFWYVVAKQGETVPPTNVHWMIAWESEAEMTARWATVRASAAWQEIFKNMLDPATGERKYHRKIQSVLLAPIPSSPLR